MSSSRTDSSRMTLSRTRSPRAILFRPCCEGTLADRPNRFLCRVEVNRRIHPVHCPNPGRMLELLVPGAKVILEEAGTGVRKTPSPTQATGCRPRSTGRRGRKTDFTLAAVYHRGQVVPLISARANKAAEKLVLPRLFPEALQIKREAAYRSSRFDFQIRMPEGVLLLEVKSCTLVEHRTALFPDAPTQRGSRHLEHLCRFTDEGGCGGVIFVIMQPEADVFMPNIHTDPVFSRKLTDCQSRLSVYASSIRCGPGGEAFLHRLSVPVDFQKVERHLADSGCYLLLLELPEDKALEVGSLGRLDLRKGFYIYVGSAKGNLDARIKRHRRQRKKIFWHIDYLRREAGRIADLPIRTARSLEHSLAGSLSDLGYRGVPGFGCSDCSCRSHLFHSENPPLTDRGFLDLLHRYRHHEALL